MIINVDNCQHFLKRCFAIQEPNQKQMYSRGMFNSEHPPEMTGFFVLGTAQLAKEMANWPGMEK